MSLEKYFTHQAMNKGLPCAFEEYELFKNGVWEKVTKGIPTSKDRIRL